MSCFFAPGLTDQFTQISILKPFQRWFVHHFKFVIPLMYGLWWAPLFPRPVPVTTVLGAPISVPQCENPSEELKSKIHAQYCEALKALYEKYKIQCGYDPKRQLKII